MDMVITYSDGEGGDAGVGSDLEHAAAIDKTSSRISDGTGADWAIVGVPEGLRG